MLPFDWDDLRFFHAAMTATTLSEAARSIGVAQATMSRRISGLEDKLGRVLFDRARGGLVPTETALALAPHAESMRAVAQHAHDDMAGLDSTPEGTVRFALPPGIAFDIVPALLPRLRHVAPLVSLEVLSGTGLVDLARRDADIAVRAIRPTHQDLVFRRLPAAPVHAYAHPDYIEQLPRHYSASDVDWIQYSSSLSHIPMARWVEETLNGRDAAFVSDDFLTMRQVALAGIGAMLLPSVQATPFGLVKLDRVTVHLEGLHWYVVTLQALQRVPRVRAVLDLVVESAEELVAQG